MTHEQDRRAWQARPGGRIGAALAATVALACTLPAQAAALAGQQFDDTLQLHDSRLRLNGLGLRGVAWIQAFVAGLYVASPTSDAQAILADPSAKRLRLKMMMDAPAAELAKAIRGGLKKNTTPEEWAAMAPRLAEFEARMRALGSEVRKGDTLDLDWTPSRGLMLAHNQRSLGAPIAGFDFYRGVLKIFIGDKPVDTRMRRGLLGGAAAEAAAASSPDAPAQPVSASAQP